MQGRECWTPGMKERRQAASIWTLGMHGRSRDAHLKLRDPLLAITCALQQIVKHCCTTSMQQKVDSPAVPVGGVYEHGRLCSDGRHRREHTRERSDGQAQMAENRPWVRVCARAPRVPATIVRHRHRGEGMRRFWKVRERQEKVSGERSFAAE